MSDEQKLFLTHVTKDFHSLLITYQPSLITIFLRLFNNILRLKVCARTECETEKF